MKALVVDDSRVIRKIVGHALMEMGFDVSEAEHGGEALQSLNATGATDLVMIDWNMPEMNGLELVKALRADHRYDGVQLVMLTTESQTARVIEALEAGANEYIMKPFDRQILSQKLTLLGLA